MLDERVRRFRDSHPQSRVSIALRLANSRQKHGPPGSGRRSCARAREEHPRTAVVLPSGVGGTTPSWLSHRTPAEAMERWGPVDVVVIPQALCGEIALPDQTIMPSDSRQNVDDGRSPPGVRELTEKNVPTPADALRRWEQVLLDASAPAGDGQDGRSHHEAIDVVATIRTKLRERGVLP